jgi:hypothetical protein
MSTLQSKVSFTLPTTNNDGSPITEALSAVVFIDTVSPPIASYPVPAANVAAAVGGVVTATFAQLGFVPKAGTDYFASADVTDADGTSLLAADVSFAYGVAPNPPTGFLVS